MTGIDHRPQPRYPFPFVQADALEYLEKHGNEYDAIHASPPCQRFSAASMCREGWQHHPDLLAPTRELLRKSDRPWVIENVERAPMQKPAILLCGLMFDLKVLRHRWFESNKLLLAPSHTAHRGKRIGSNGMVCVAGHGSVSRANRQRTPADHRNKASWCRGMGIDWMSRDELAQAIPPAYTLWIGRQLISILDHGLESIQALGWTETAHAHR